MTVSDLSLPWTLAGLVFVVAVIAAVLLVSWLSKRYIRVELICDTGVARDRPAGAFAPGRLGNPPLVYFLELLYDGRVESVVVMHRVGATVGLTDGSMVMHDRFGRVISRLSGDEVAYHRALGDTTS